MGDCGVRFALWLLAVLNFPETTSSTQLANFRGEMIMRDEFGGQQRVDLSGKFGAKDILLFVASSPRAFLLESSHCVLTFESPSDKPYF